MVVKTDLTDPLHPLSKFPVLGICGDTGTGRTILIQALIRELRLMGLQTAVIKANAHHAQNCSGENKSDHFFCGSADISPTQEQYFIAPYQPDEFFSLLITLCSCYDLVLVEGDTGAELPKIWLSPSNSSPDMPPKCKEHIIPSLNNDQAAVDQLFQLITSLITDRWESTPVWGCILIGGRSSRMGSPKHLIRQKGRTWLEQAVETLGSKVEQIVISGSGEIPDSLTEIVRIPDAPGLAGPLAGILSVMRWQPAVSWLIMACDQPDVQPESLTWLLAQRRPGVRAVLPDLLGDGHLEPLLAWYDFRCRSQLEIIAASGSPKLSRLAHQRGICHAQPPEHLHRSWRNVNTPDQVNRTKKRACRKLENPC